MVIPVTPTGEGTSQTVGNNEWHSSPSGGWRALLPPATRFQKISPII